MLRRIAANVECLRREVTGACANAGRSPDSVSIVAVTKNQDPSVLAPLIAAGICDFGENRTAHLEHMIASAPAGSRFHYIGRVQSRQLKVVAADCLSLHSLCETPHVDRLAVAVSNAGHPLDCFLQVNVSGEPQKAGASPDKLPQLMEACARHDAITVVGLMTMAPDSREGQVGADAVRRCFAATRQLAEAHGLKRLSMGMSADFAIAIEEGATDIRVGTRLFL